MALRANVTDVVGLSEANRRLLKQRGALDGFPDLDEGSSESEESDNEEQKAQKEKEEKEGEEEEEAMKQEITNPATE